MLVLCSQIRDVIRRRTRFVVTAGLLENKRVIVTGASSGIGRALALACLRAGASVSLQGRDRARLEEVAAAAGTTRSEIASFDLAHEREVARFMEGFAAKHGSLDILVHSAAEYVSATVDDTEPADFDRLFAVNVRAVWQLTRGLLPLLRRSAGQLVFVNSSVIEQAAAEKSLYAMTKGAAKTLADSVRAEVNKDGVRVLSLVLGRTATPLQHRIAQVAGDAYKPERLLQPEDVASIAISAMALPHTAEVTEIFIRPTLKQ